MAIRPEPLQRRLCEQLCANSILAFSDQAKIPPMDLARLSDVGGDMVSSLASSDDLRRKLNRRIA